MMLGSMIRLVESRGSTAGEMPRSATDLHATHVSGEGGLVTHSGGDTTQQGRHLGTSLCESEDVVNEEQHVLTLLVTEILGDSESSQGNTGTGTGGLVHLTVDKGDLGGLVLEADDSALNHLKVQIVTLTGPLSHSGENRVTSVSLGNVVNQFHDQHSLADTSAAEEANLASLGIGGKEVDNLDTSDKNLLLDAHVLKLGGVSVDGLPLLSVDRAPLVNGISDHVDDSAESLRSDR